MTASDRPDQRMVALLLTGVAGLAPAGLPGFSQPQLLAQLESRDQPASSTLIQQLRRLLGLRRSSAGGGLRARADQGETERRTATGSGWNASSFGATAGALWAERSSMPAAAAAPSATSLPFAAALPQARTAIPQATAVFAAPPSGPGIGSSSGRNRSDSGDACLIVPMLSFAPGEPLQATTFSPTPPIASRRPLADVRLLQGDQLLWQQRFPADQPQPRLLAWPISPLAPGATVNLEIVEAGSSSPRPLLIRLRRLEEPAGTSSAEAASSDALGSEAQLQAALQQHIALNQSGAALELVFQAALRGLPTWKALADEALNAGCEDQEAMGRP